MKPRSIHFLSLAFPPCSPCPPWFRFCLPFASVSCAATGKVEDRAGGEGAILGAGPADGGGDFLDQAEAAHGNLGQHVVDVLLRDLVENRRLHPFRRHDVNRTFVLSPFPPR